MRQVRSEQRLLSMGSVLLIIVLVFGLFATACGDADEPDPTPTGSGGQPVATVEPTPTETAAAGSEYERIGPPALPNTEAEAFVDGINAFAFDFYQFVTDQQDDNLIYSPASIELAFSMVYAGARTTTEEQMADVLGFLPQETQHPAANALDGHLNALGEDPPTEGDGEPFQLSITNSTWAQEGYPFEEAFLQILAEHYGASMEFVDFTTEFEAARELINDWIAERTEGRIENAVPEGAIKPNTRLVLANAIYFKAGWLFPFNADATTDAIFGLIDGSEVTVPMMHHQAARVPYASGDGYQAIALPYTGRSVEMNIIVPDAGRFEEIEANLSPEFLAQALAGAETRDVNLQMPKFDFKTDLDLTTILPEMGMPDPFGPADFSGMSSGGLFIGEAIHSATIAVDEKGTEAAAVTVIAMDESAMQPAELTLDRPFIFAITDSETGAILFMGRVMNPAE